MASPEVKRKKSCDYDDNDGKPAQLSDKNGDVSVATTTYESIHPTTSAITDETGESKVNVDKSNYDDRGVGSNGDTERKYVSDNESMERDAYRQNDDDKSDNQDKIENDVNAGTDGDKKEGEESEEDDCDAATRLERKYGYRFNGFGQLRHVATGAEFEFNVFDGDKAKNQRRYEEIGKLVDLVVYELLETSVNLQRIRIPQDAARDESTGFVFASPDLDTNSRLLVLIHGSGVVRAGQWARRLIINDCLDSGTQLPFIRKARSMGYSTLVLNTNQNSAPIPGSKSPSIPIRGSESPIAHGVNVWEKLVMSNPRLTDIVVVAHSFGGVVTIDIASEFSNFWRSRVKAVAFTDSVHGERAFTLDRRLAAWFAGHSVNWVTSEKEVDSPLRRSSTVPCVSAGHTSHENTSWSAFKSIFEFFKLKLEQSS